MTEFEFDSSVSFGPALAPWVRAQGGGIIRIWLRAIIRIACCSPAAPAAPAHFRIERTYKLHDTFARFALDALDACAKHHNSFLKGNNSILDQS